MTITENEPKHLIFERIVIGLTAIGSGIALFLIVYLGPLITGTLQYRISESGVYQIMGGDFVNLVLVVPILLIGGVLHLAKRDNSKYFLILTPILLIFTGIYLSIGQEWSDPTMVGNVEHYAWLIIPLITAGLLLGMSSLSMFDESDAPKIPSKQRWIFITVMGLFMLLFASMWIGDLVEVIMTGNTSNGDYLSSPTVWWAVRVLDLAISIPLGFIALYLLGTRPEKAYPLLLLFFGFFVTLGTQVNAMGWIMFLTNDPYFDPAALAIFGFLGIIAWSGLLFLVKDKFRGISRKTQQYSTNSISQSPPKSKSWWSM